jgi:periplasmic protein TonB
MTIKTLRTALWTDHRGWCIGMASSLLLHLAVVAAFLFRLEAPSQTVMAPMAAMMVELAPTRVAPAVTPKEVAPGKPKVETAKAEPPKPKPKVKTPRFEPPPVIDAPNAEIKVAQQDKIEPPRPPVAKPVTQTTAEPTVSAPPADTMKAPNAEKTWESTLLAHLEKLKRYPYMAQRAGQEDVIYIAFTIDRQGKVLDFEIKRSRGYALLDGEVRSLIERASPLPPPPAEVTGERIKMVVPVEFFVRRS